MSQGPLDAAGKDSANFSHSNMNYEQTRYCPAKQINTDNVGKLKPAFIFQIGTNGGEYGTRGFVKAYDANNGKLL